MSRFNQMLLAGAVGVAFAVAGQAQAAPVQFTLDLNAPPNSTQIGSGGTITADNVTISDNAHINFTAGGFSENGLFKFTSFQLGGGAVDSLGIGTKYNLYGTFTSSGTFLGTLAGTNVYRVDGFSFQLFADPTGNTNLSGLAPGVGNGDDLLIATGSILGSGDATSNASSKTVSFNATASFIPNGPNGGIFASPNPFTVDVQAIAGATGDQVTFGPGVADIKGGGGALTLIAPVPEPTTLGLFGTGLIGLAAFARRRKRA